MNYAGIISKSCGGIELTYTQDQFDLKKSLIGIEVLHLFLKNTTSLPKKNLTGF
jgi:hypothetical protein